MHTFTKNESSEFNELLNVLWFIPYSLSLFLGLWLGFRLSVLVGIIPESMKGLQSDVLVVAGAFAMLHISMLIIDLFNMRVATTWTHTLRLFSKNFLYGFMLLSLLDAYDSSYLKFETFPNGLELISSTGVSYLHMPTVLLTLVMLGGYITIHNCNFLTDDEYRRAGRWLIKKLKSARLNVGAKS